MRNTSVLLCLTALAGCIADRDAAREAADYSTPPECADLDPCPSGESCVGGTCVPACSISLDCASNEFCDSGGCVPATVADCNRSDECNPGWFCFDGTCSKRVGAGLGCIDNEGCSSDVCRGGICCANSCEGPCRACTPRTATDPGGECLTAGKGADPNGECRFGCTPLNTCQSLGSVCSGPAQCGEGECVGAQCCLPIEFSSPSSVAVLENTSGAVLTIVASLDQLTDASYSFISGDDSAQLQIDSGTGEISFLAAPDFEAPSDANLDNRYDVNVLAAFPSGCSESIAVTIEVLDESRLTAVVDYPIENSNLDGAATVSSRGRLFDDEDNVVLADDVQSFSVSGVSPDVSHGEITRWSAQVPAGSLQISLQSRSSTVASFEYALRNVPELLDAFWVSLDSKRNRVLTISSNQFYAVSLDTGLREQVSFGDIFLPRSMSVSESGDTLYVAGGHRGEATLSRIDLVNDTSILVTGPTRGSGPQFESRPVVVSADERVAYVWGTTAGIVEIRIADGERTQLSTSTF
ncbi:MAG: cadherin repeat domain-containing protein, partial [Myxococcota bacterium]